MKSVFIDGQAGTTGLQIAARLRRRDDIELITIDDADRKNDVVKKKCCDAADLVILCLPDAAARATVRLAPAARLLDASTAHRVAPDWSYGMPELCPGQRTAIASSPRVSNPGCYPTGFILLVRPLIDAGVLPSNVPLRAHAVSGFSGGGKALIEKYQSNDSAAWQTRPYALGLKHKHVPEMHHYSGTDTEPLFMPTVGHFYQGMLVQIPLFYSEFAPSTTPEILCQVFEERYADEPFVRVLPYESPEALTDGFLSPTACNDTNIIELMVFGNDTQALLVARLDNLGKGASGAAVQNMNLMLGFDETTGLVESSTG